MLFVSLTYESYLCLVAMATQSITSAATPTIKPRMMIQSGHMGEVCYKGGMSVIRVLIVQKCGFCLTHRV